MQKFVNNISTAVDPKIVTVFNFPSYFPGPDNLRITYRKIRSLSVLAAENLFGRGLLQHFQKLHTAFFPESACSLPC